MPNKKLDHAALERAVLQELHRQGLKCGAAAIREDYGEYTTIRFKARAKKVQPKEKPKKPTYDFSHNPIENVPLVEAGLLLGTDQAALSIGLPRGSFTYIAQRLKIVPNRQRIPHPFGDNSVAYRNRYSSDQINEVSRHTIRPDHADGD